MGTDDSTPSKRESGGRGGNPPRLQAVSPASTMPDDVVALMATATAAIAVLLYAAQRKRHPSSESGTMPDGYSISPDEHDVSPPISPHRSSMSSMMDSFALPEIDATPTTNAAFDEGDPLTPGLERRHSFIGGDRTRDAKPDSDEALEPVSPVRPVRHESFALAQVMV